MTQSLLLLKFIKPVVIFYISGRNTFMSLLSLILFISNTTFWNSRIMLIVVPWKVACDWDVVYCPTLRAFDQSTAPQRIPYLSLAATTNENAKLWSAPLDYITIETNKRICICRNHLLPATILANDLPSF